MDDTAGPPDPQARLAETYAEVEDALLSRWPETRLDPSLDRIEAFMELLGDPQRSYPVIHVTGTNGKTSSARMIETLIQTTGLRVGRFTSPHLESMTERISVDGEPVSEETFVSAFNDVAPYLDLVDAEHDHPLSFFETVVAMAYAAFADAPVDAAVVEVGMGGTWDATNVMDAKVAVLTPVALDHAQYLGETPTAIALEKVGIIKPGATVVCATQSPEVDEVVRERCAEVGATLAREGLEFGVTSRVPAVGGQLIALQGLRGTYDEVFLPLYGAHQAENAALALAAVEALLGGEEPLDIEPGQGGVRRGDLSGSPRDHQALTDDRPGCGSQPARCCGGRGCVGGLLRVLATDRCGRGDGRQGLRRRPRRARAGALPHRVHPELHGTLDAGPATSPRWRSASSARTA